MPMASRYLATVRRATGMPSPESSSAMRPSLKGASGSSSFTSLRILARMAVEEVPEPSSALDLAGEEIAQLEHPARGVHVLAGGHARDGGFVHGDRFGDVLEDHRPHVLVALLEEGRLALDDRAGDLHERLVADLEALEQPARLLQLRAHGGVAGVAADEAGVTLIEAHARQGGGVELDAPAVIGAAHEHIRHHVFGAAGADGRAGARMAGAHQRQRAGEFLLGGAQFARAAATARARRPAPGDGVRSRWRWRSRGWPGPAAAAAARCTRSTERAPTPGGSSACTTAQHARRLPRSSTPAPGAASARSPRAIR